MSPAEGARSEESAPCAERWWATAAIHRFGHTVLDDEVCYVDSLLAEAAPLPGWAVQVRDMMPRYGFEMCAHRWVEGLEQTLAMMGQHRTFPSTAGRCGDVPESVRAGAWERAVEVSNWVEGVLPATRLGEQIAGWLGRHKPDRAEAARCFTELVRLAFSRSPEDQRRFADRAALWRSRTRDNAPLHAIFSSGEGFDELLRHRCGFKLLDRLDVVIRTIGGDPSQTHQLAGVCNQQLRFVLRDAAERYRTTRSVLWALYACWSGEDADWLGRRKPDCAETGSCALAELGPLADHDPLHRWLLASMLKATKIWCEATLNCTPKEQVPDWAHDLPALSG